MIRRSIRLVWTGAVIGFVTYALFFVRLGERTPFQHLMRIINTDEAQELGREVGVVTTRITQRIGEQIADANEPPAQDAGTSKVPEAVIDQLQPVAGQASRREQHIESERDRHLK